MSDASQRVADARDEVQRRQRVYVRAVRWLLLPAVVLVLPAVVDRLTGMGIERWLAGWLSLMGVGLVVAIFGLMLWRYAASRRLTRALTDQRLAELQRFNDSVRDSLSQQKTDPT